MAGYAADWALFTDWCAATNHHAFPAEAATISAFTTATRRARYPAPPSGCDRTSPPRRRPRGNSGNRSRSQTPATAAPGTAGPGPGRDGAAGVGRSDGTSLSGVGRHDRRPIRHRRRAAGATDTSGGIHLIEAVADPVRCGPCALVRWRRVVDAEVGGTSAKRMAQLLKDAHTVTPASRHVCQAPTSIRAKTLPGGKRVGHLELRRSQVCAAVWVRVVFDLNVGPTLKGMTARITMIRPADGVRAPYPLPLRGRDAGFGNMLSDAGVCVQAEVFLQSGGTGQSGPTAQTVCA